MNFDTDLFIENTNLLGITLSPQQLDEFDTFAKMLIETNKVMNLTAITDPQGIAVKHFADSLTIMNAVKFENRDKVLDIGTGAGIPGIPLLIMNNEINLTLNDSTAKKLRFVQSVIEELKLKAEIIHARAEELGRDNKYRETYDYAVSRAVAPLNVLCEYSLPLIKIGGKFIALKGSKTEEEISGAEKTITLLGGKLSEVIPIDLTDGISRNIVFIEKVNATPEKYPRPTAQIIKNK